MLSDENPQNIIQFGSVGRALKFCFPAGSAGGVPVTTEDNRSRFGIGTTQSLASVSSLFALWLSEDSGANGHPDRSGHSGRRSA